MTIGKLIGVECSLILNIRRKLFRLRFRIPSLVFKEFLVPMCKDANIFSISEESKVRVPMEFKFLMCLRILSRGNVADNIAELSSGCPSTVNWLSIFLFDTIASSWCQPKPQHLEQLESIEKRVYIVLMCYLVSRIEKKREGAPTQHICQHCDERCEMR